MSNHRVLTPGLPAAQFDSFDSDEDADDPIEDEHHVIFAFLAMCMPDSFSGICSAKRLQLLVTC